jgi:hypothetical protein
MPSMSQTSFTHPERSALSSIGWQGRLDEATTPEEVVSTARDFVASWTPQEIASLPRPCRPWKIVDADDVAAYAIQLAQEGTAETDAAAPVDKMCAFFSSASLRVSQIRRPGETSS